MQVKIVKRYRFTLNIVIVSFLIIEIFAGKGAAFLLLYLISNKKEWAIVGRLLCTQSLHYRHVLHPYMHESLYREFKELAEWKRH